MGMFSAARFIRLYGKYLHDEYPDWSLRIGGVNRTSVELYKALIDSINAAYDAIIHESGTLDSLYSNPFGVVDGPWCVHS